MPEGPSCLFSANLLSSDSGVMKPRANLLERDGLSFTTFGDLNDALLFAGPAFD